MNSSLTVSRRNLLAVGCLLALSALPATATAQTVTVAAASDLRYALDEVVTAFRASQPGVVVEVVYGSSGNLATQIRNGAPFHLFMSADVAFAQGLVASGHAVGKPQLYGIGRLALWSLDPALVALPLERLVTQPQVQRFAIANPAHAPYGQRAVEALRIRGAYDAVQSKLVLGDNVSQAAQFVSTGAAQAGIVAYSLTLGPTLAGKGHWVLLPESWHAPLEQAFVVTRAGAAVPGSAAFAAFLQSPAARKVLVAYGFGLPGEAAAR